MLPWGNRVALTAAGRSPFFVPRCCVPVGNWVKHEWFHRDYDTENTQNLYFSHWKIPEIELKARLTAKQSKSKQNNELRTTSCFVILSNVSITFSTQEKFIYKTDCKDQQSITEKVTAGLMLVYRKKEKFRCNTKRYRNLDFWRHSRSALDKGRLFPKIDVEV